jgi:serine/arginine repetitive matrix protein 1
MRKVELSVLKPWISKKVIELLGFEDDVLIEYVSGLLEDEENKVRSYSSSRSMLLNRS